MEIDNREPEAYIRAICVPLTDHVVVTLPSGDYAWNGKYGRVVVERKTISDFVASLHDGRWAQQIPRLQSAQFPILLLEGALEYSPDGKVMLRGQEQAWSPEYLDGALLTAQRLGVYVAHCPSGPGAVARKLVSLQRWCDRLIHSTLEPRGAGSLYSSDPAENAAIAMLCCLPGVGQSTSRRLIDKWGSVTAALNAAARGDIPGALGERLKSFARGGQF
jgi:ERCC4-type nuclease